MKNIFHITATLIIALAVFTGCAGGPKASGPDELDMAIRDASDYLNDNIPQGSKIVILNVQSDSAALSNYIIDELIANTVNDRIFSVVDRAQLDAIRAEQNFQWSGEVDDNLALEVGKFFGAQTIVSGTVSMLGSRHRLTIRALEVQTAQVQGQFNKNINTSETVAALMKSGGGSGGQAATGGTTAVTASGGRTQTGTSSGTTAPAAQATAQPAAPVLANGTYTFNPRPRVREAGGNWVNMWLTKVVVESRFITFYFDNRATGAGNGAGDSFQSDWSAGNVTLYNLDRQSVFVKSTGLTVINRDPESIIFPRIDSKRFRMETVAYGRDKGIEEINLDNAEYEP